MKPTKGENREKTNMNEEKELFPRANPYNSRAWVIGEPKIGAGTWIGAFTVIDGSGGLTIGEKCDISCGVHIYTHSTTKRCILGKKFNEDGSVNRELIERKPVEIGDCTFIGANATIMMGVKIGKCCIIGAGAVVTKDVPDYSVAAGVPAKITGKIMIKDGEIEIKKVEEK